jgi:hypothetical protein
VLLVHEATRPSALVCEVKDNGVEARRVSVTGIELAGLPMDVSSTWHVMGGFFSVAIALCADSVGLGEVLRCDERAEMRWVAVVEGVMRVRFVRWVGKWLMRCFEPQLLMIN